MRVPSIAARGLLAGLLLFPAAAGAAEIKVMISGGFSAAYEKLMPEFERASGHKVVTLRGASMGETPQAIPNRLARGEDADVVIMVGYALGRLIDQGKVRADSRVDLAWSRIAMAVRAGAPKPDIATVESFKQALLAAKSIAYSDSASGVYLSTELFRRIGVYDAIKDRARKISGEPVARVVARGEAEIGFQPVSELRPHPGIDIVGPIPDELQIVNVFAAGLASHAKEPDAGKALIAYLVSPAANGAILASGMEFADAAKK
ncbi:MAG: molybdate transport system substrate-binding protein [Hyphomicrobiales bacterium]|jgi:molybdate transport system substrate-binding protein|nr:molybdate transport system substrate-binding protein [Hyphomicrobiales bacterium]